MTPNLKNKNEEGEVKQVYDLKNQILQEKLSINQMDELSVNISTFGFEV